MMDQNEIEGIETESSWIFQMETEDVAERMEVMMLQEEGTYKCVDVFGMTSSFSNKNIDESEEQEQKNERKIVDVSCRTKLCEWCYQIVDHCNFRRETVDIAMSLLDRFVGTERHCAAAQRALRDKRQYQLAAMTSLYMAIKLFESLEVETTLLADLSKGIYTPLDISQMEHQILSALEWRLNGPTRSVIAQHLLTLLPPEIQDDTQALDAIVELTQFQTELATKDYFFVTTKQSSVALACILNAIDAARTTHSHRQQFIESISTYTTIDPFSTQVYDARSRLLDNAGLRLSTLTVLPSSPTVVLDNNNNYYNPNHDSTTTTTSSPKPQQQSTTKSRSGFDWVNDDDDDDDDDDYGYYHDDKDYEYYDDDDYEYSPVCVRTAAIQQH